MVITLLAADCCGSHARSLPHVQFSRDTACADLATTRAPTCRIYWRTARLIVQCTRALPAAPRVEPARRQLQKPQDPSQWNGHASALDRAQQSRLVGTVHEPLAGARMSAAWSQTRVSRSRAASLVTRRCSVRISCRSSASVLSASLRLMTSVDEPTSHPRAVDRGTPPRRQAEFARASDEFPEPMVMTLLSAECSGHARSSLRAPCEGRRGLRRLGDNSHLGVQNVLAHSTAASRTEGPGAVHQRPAGTRTETPLLPSGGPKNHAPSRGCL